MKRGRPALAAQRVASGLTQEALAELLGIDRSTVMRWERGRTTPQPWLRPELARALGIACSQLDNLLAPPATVTPLHLVSGEGGGGEWAAGSSDASDNEITVAYRAADGGVVLVQVPRRTFLLGAIGAGISAVTPPSARPSRKGGWATTCPPGELSPVESFEQVRSMLISQDNLAGPGAVLPAVREQMRLIHQFRQDSDGADRRALLRVQAHYAEFAGWLCQDLGHARDAKAWTSQALEWAHAVGDHDMISYVLARKSHLAAEMMDATTAIEMAEAAGQSAAPCSRLKAVSATYGAYGHALAGNSRASAQAIDSAVTQLLGTDDDDSSWAPWLDRSYIEVQAGRCHARLGQHAKAIAAYQSALDVLPVQYRRDRGVYLARQAVAHARAGDIDQAATLGIQAVHIAMITGSQRITADLALLDGEISNHARDPSVADFREALTVVLHEA